MKDSHPTIILDGSRYNYNNWGTKDMSTRACQQYLYPVIHTIITLDGSHGNRTNRWVLVQCNYNNCKDRCRKVIVELWGINHNYLRWGVPCAAGRGSGWWVNMSSIYLIDVCATLRSLQHRKCCVRTLSGPCEWYSRSTRDWLPVCRLVAVMSVCPWSLKHWLLSVFYCMLFSVYLFCLIIAQGVCTAKIIIIIYNN